jgi:SAM-dependent methyltransferase
MRLKDRLVNRFAGAFASRAAGAGAGSVGARNDATRVAWLERTLKQIPAGARILDAGAGERRFKPLCAHLTYVSQDFGQYDGKGDAAGLQMGSWDQSGLDIVCDITNIPEPDASFDAVMCVEVLEHLPDPVLAIRELSRLMRGGGQLIVTAPFCSITHLAPYHFHTGFSRYFYETHFPTHGLEIVEMEANGNYFEYLAQELRRVPEMAGLYAKDRPDSLETSAAEIVLRMLERFSGEDENSAEVLNFGYHVRALKKL